MSTILSSYNLANGDTTSSVFTYSGSSRNLDIEILPAELTGYSSYCFVETSADNINWVKTPHSDLPIKESDAVIYHLTQSEGAYVRVKLFRMDSHTGTVTITASEPSGGGSGDLLAANNLSDVADAATSNHNLGNSHLTYTPTCTTIVGTGTMTPLADCFVIQVDSDSVSFTFYFQIDLGGGETDGTFTFTLPPSLLPTNNFAANGDLQFVMGLPNAAQWTVDDVIGYNATVGAKTGSISYQSATAGDTKKITAFIRYHR